MCSLYRTVKLEDGCYSDALTKMVSTYALFFICPFLALTDTHLFLHQSSHIVCISCQFAVCLGSWCRDQDRIGSYSSRTHFWLKTEDQIEYMILLFPAVGYEGIKTG